ncbi:uncharacterized protein LOC112268806 [Brachypodium distachyon]|uniref:uncharacterized protein LOC112268806 n=1 Tax=Brachypodium distachyon TaxID=15368 RepID=UPI000D0D972B|nr:uncharacterized protein LOC112268806 [Brachypodium distachyon]|eukprot:XP_024310709.1 uncharacterized protein LOC112268806 [Brachypodium distachyon]
MIRWGEGIFDCVRISLDVTKPLARFASLIKDGKRGVFQVTYEEGTASLKKTREVQSSEDLGCESTPIDPRRRPTTPTNPRFRKVVLGSEMEIAVGALSGMVDALPGKLGELLQQEFKLLSGVRGDVAFFQAELGAMHAAVLRCRLLLFSSHAANP